MSLRFIISPAKKMRAQDMPPWPAHEPVFLERAADLMRAVQGLSRDEAQALWGCSDRHADLNYERFRTMDLMRDTTAAAIAYEGIQYTHLAPHVMSERELAWLDEHLRILSGFYGMLRPLDGVVPYRLEMQARLVVGTTRDLYEFWGNALYEALAAEGCDTIVNVASVEYARAVTPWVRSDGPQVTTCIFGVMRDGRLRQPATEAKAARGTFMRWCAEHEVTNTDELASFAERGYARDAANTSSDTLVFVKRA